MTFGTGGSAPSGCNVVTDKVGTDDMSGSPPARYQGYAYCSLFTPTCYGALKTAYSRHGSVKTSSAKICVYENTDGDTTADSDDDKLGCSGDITSGSVEWVSSEMDGGTLTSGNAWVCLFVKSDAETAYEVDTTLTEVPFAYKTSGNYYASPPANLGGMTNAAASRGMTNYVTIGN